MKNTAETIILENINFTQLLLHDLDEQRFNAYTSYHQTSILQIHSYIVNLLYQLNDKRVLNEKYLNAICQFLDIEQVDNVETLISVLNEKRIQANGLEPLTLVEFQNMIQCVKFMAKDSNVDVTRIVGISEMTNTVRKMKLYEMA